MARLEELTRGSSIKGILPDGLVTVLDVKWIGTLAIELTYKEVTDYVREEFNRAEALENEGRKGTVGFALTILQRRLASSPEAIFQSIRRRRERLEKRLREEQLLKRGAEARIEPAPELPACTPDDLDDLEDAPDEEVEQTEDQVVDQATAARTIAELRTEIAMLQDLEQLALKVRQSGTDRKWEELSRLLQNNAEMFDAHGHRRKLVIFTEHRDTLNYLADRIRALLGRPESLVTIHGGLGREDRRKAQESFTQDKEVEILGSHSPVPDLNWGVIIQIEKKIALASVSAMIKESAKWGIVFALAACVVGLFLARWITRPIQDLAQHALAIGRNQNFDQKIELQASNEIQQLADTFNFMTEEIRQNIIRLQTAARENKELFMSSIRMLAAAIDAKDPYTRGHSERVKDFALVIAKSMGFNEAEMERIEIAALLHDVGKIGIEDRILRKPTNLTPDEFEIMKMHPDKGANILSQIAQLADIVPSTRAHHENYDGSGYPKGLKGEEIPLIARVITVADTFDAMTTDRPYQKAFTLEFALNRIRTMVNVKYDPKVVQAFSRSCEEGKVTLHKPSRPRPKQAVGS